MRLGDYETHPVADAFPLLEGTEWERFLDSIRDNGFLDRTVWLYKGRILDGRNRYRASLELGTKVRFREWEGDDPIAFVKATNYDRRNMSPSVKALVACRLANMRPGRPKKTATGGVKQEEAARRFDVSLSLLKEAKLLLQNGCAELVSAVERDGLTIGEALELVHLSPNQQVEALRKIAEAETTKARRKAVRQASHKEQDEGSDPMTRLMRAVVRTAEDLGASVRMLSTLKGGFALEVAFGGQHLTMTIAAATQPELVA